MSLYFNFFASFASSSSRIIFNPSKLILQFFLRQVTLFNVRLVMFLQIIATGERPFAERKEKSVALICTMDGIEVTTKMLRTPEAFFAKSSVYIAFFEKGTVKVVMELGPFSMVHYGHSGRSRTI